MAEGDLLIGVGNSLRGDDGVGTWLAGWAQQRWPRLRVCSVQQLTPELSCELAVARRVLFLDACCGLPQGATQDGWVDPGAQSPGRAATGLVSDGPRAPVLLPLRLAAAADALSADVGAFSHRLDPAQLLAITALLHSRVPQAWLLLVPAYRFEHGEGLSAPVQAQLAEAQALLRQWCDSRA